MTNPSKRTLLFTGAYAERDESGVCVYEFNENSGEMKLLDQVSDCYVKEGTARTAYSSRCIGVGRSRQIV